MKTQDKRKLRGGMWRAMLLTLLTFFASAAVAQNVTISPKTGNVIAAASYSGESHLDGFGGAWIHNQMPLTLFTSDEATLGENGLMAKHANNICANDDGTFTMTSGAGSVVNHVSLSLPKGYRFTGYKMVFEYVSGPSCTMSERESTFKTPYKTATTVSSSNKKATLERTGDNMGNVLYFYHGHQSSNNSSSRIKITSFEISFECDNSFSEALRPSTSVSGVDCARIAFNTQRADLGEITWTRGNGDKSANRYDYKNVKSLGVYFDLYDNDGISNGTASTSAKKNGHISATEGKYFALQNDTYWLETPTEAASNNSTIPVGYRITGARLHYYGSSSKAISKGSDFYITDGSGKYMNSSLNFTTTPVVWHSDSDGRIYTESGSSTVYLTHEKQLVTNVCTKTLKTTTSKNDAREYTSFDNNQVTYYAKTKEGGLFSKDEYETWYLSVSNGKGSYTGTKAQVINVNYAIYTLNLYGTDGNTVAKTVNVGTDSSTGYLEVTSLNNDAIKFEVSDLQGSAAYVYADLTLEALNPYVSKMDVVAKTKDDAKTIAQSYLADDFAVGDGGSVSISVPDNFASDGVQIVFDNLTSKKADNTYGDLSADGNSRYHFVKSDYYNTINENLQGHRADAANYDYQKKVTVALAGDRMFQVNNSDKFKTGTGQISSTFYYEENRYSNSAYQTQGGTWAEVKLTKDDNNKACYLVICDETRYNIAPTTTPRHAFYAYYNTNVTLDIADYEPALSYVKVYDNAMLQDGFDNNAYYGVKVGAKMENGTAVAEGKGYLFAKQIKDQIASDAGKANCPKDASHVLYIDASSLNSVLYSKDNADYGTLEGLKEAIGTNAMIYMPKGVTYSMDNLASKTVSGDFKAENNIVLADRKPFFAPYDIRMDVNNYTQYTREVTYDHGQTKYITLVLPFTMDVMEGTHQNKDGKTFKFYKMQLDNAISTEKENDYDYQVTGHFAAIDGNATESNVPYLVEVSYGDSNDGDSETLFTAQQYGASITATPTDNSGLGTMLDGETASGKIGSSNVTFTQHGAFNGVQLAKSAGTYFYFSKDKFVSSDNLSALHPYVYVMPFRSYYDYIGAKGAKYMNISLEPNTDVTGIDDIAAAADSEISLSTASGNLTITANKDAKVSVRNLNGQTVAAMSMAAGTTKSVVVPAGMYIVNGVKVIVK